MISYHVDHMMGQFEVMSPCLESLEDSKEFLVVCVVELGTHKGMTVECDGVNIAIISTKGEDACNGIVRGIRFHYGQ